MWRHEKLKIHLHENFIPVVGMLKICLDTLKYFEKLLLALLFYVLSEYYLKGRNFRGPLVRNLQVLRN